MHVPVLENIRKLYVQCMKNVHLLFQGVTGEQKKRRFLKGIDLKLEFPGGYQTFFPPKGRYGKFLSGTTNLQFGQFTHSNHLVAALY